MTTPQAPGASEKRSPRLAAAALLLVVSMAWGATFVVVKGAVAHSGVFEFLAWRFVVAGILLVVLRPLAVACLGARQWAQGLALGGILAVAYACQTYGLRYTTAALSGFLTGLQVVFTPLLLWLLFRRRVGARTWVAVALALAGLAVLSLRGLAFGLGESLTVAAAALFALQIVLLGRWASVKDAYGLAAVQLLAVGAVSLCAAAPGPLGVPRSPGMWGAVALTAVAATAFAFVVQSWAQSHLSAPATAVVFTAEPVFAAVFAWAAGERFGWPTLVAGALVVLAMAVLGLQRGAPPQVRGCMRSQAFTSPRRWYRG